jgi:hypothetical protein
MAYPLRECPDRCFTLVTLESQFAEIADGRPNLLARAGPPAPVIKSRLIYADPPR